MHDAVPLLQDFLIHSARRWPDRIALVCDTRRVTYGELAGQACRLARALRRRGVERGDRVLIYADNGVEAVIAFWGALLAGAVAVPINPETRTDKLAWLLDDCRAAALVASARLAPAFVPAARRATSLKSVLVAGDAGSIADLPHATGRSTRNRTAGNGMGRTRTGNRRPPASTSASTSIWRHWSTPPAAGASRRGSCSATATC